MDLLGKAHASPRKRAHLNLHDDLNDPTQRLFVAIEPQSYIRPHRHRLPPKWECFFVFRGSASMLTFDDYGKVTGRADLSVERDSLAAEIPAGIWHTLVATSPDTVLVELKPGPYAPLNQEDFCQWAPVENTMPCAEFVPWFASATIGDLPPVL